MEECTWRKKKEEEGKTRKNQVNVGWWKGSQAGETPPHVHLPHPNLYPTFNGPLLQLYLRWSCPPTPPPLNLDISNETIRLIIVASHAAY